MVKIQGVKPYPTTPKPNTVPPSQNKMCDAGKGRKVTVPENDQSELFDAIREQISPQAVATIVACLQPAQTKDVGVNKQVRWFAEQLVDLLGGYDEQNRLAEEVGL